LIAENRAVVESTNHARIKNLAWHILPPGVYFLFSMRWYPYWNNLWIYSDEGFNLMKALLVARGYALYTQIWSDQPPLFTQLLALLFQTRGPGVYASRVLVLIFSCVLVWALVQFLRTAWDDRAAFAGAFIIVLLPQFISLSAAVQVGQPSLALAAVSLLALAAWHRKRRQLFIVLSALALSASILIKLFTGFLAPVFILGLVAAEFFSQDKEKTWSARLRPALIWLVVFGSVTLIAWFLLAGPQSLPQLIGTPWAASRATETPPNEQVFPITYYLRDSWAIFLLAGVGVLYVFRQRRWLMIYPIAWAVVALVSLLNLTPVWFHHQLLVTLPAALLAAGATAETARLAALTLQRRSMEQKLLLVSGILALFLVAASRSPDLYAILSTPAVPEERNAFEDKVLRRMEQFTDRTNWVMTDLPMYAFQVGKPVPPELAVISWKRFAAGDLSQEEILEVVEAYQPEQILLGRFEFPILDPYLAENYRLVLEREGDLALYVRSDIAH
jgi:hypothetical protein